MSKLRRAYLAGPDVFLQEAAAVAARLKQVCLNHGFLGLFPTDSPTQSGWKDIRKGNMDLVRSCDIVLANVSPFRGPNADDGTAFEIGFATGIGVPVFPYSTDLRAYRDRVVAGPGEWVEDFGLPCNLMLVHPATMVFSSPEEALRRAQSYFGVSE